jgi:uncharacterized protein YbbC (DUF1343 family)
MERVRTGVEQLIAHPPQWIKGKRLGLLCNPASVDFNLLHASDQINRQFPGQLKALFSPQHGFFAEKQDNMIESPNTFHHRLGIPVFSLYGETRVPTEEMLDLVDILLVDLQDVGTRVYTFIYTLSFCLEAAKTSGKKIVVLDRPNPINGINVEGNCLHPDFVSFVGRYPIPMRHGLTIGELSLLFNEYFQIYCDLEVIPMKNWRRSMFYSDTGLPWIPPSPNLPTPASTLVYPGQVIWEGTNVSEGRGTTQPFELFGAPFLSSSKLLTVLDPQRLSGAVLRPVIFEPTSNKWKGCPCHGFQIHVTEPLRYKPYEVSLRLLQAVIRLNKEDFEWKPPPYEYEREKQPIDLIIGDREVRQKIEKLHDIGELETTWSDGIETFKNISKDFHLYPG